MFCVTDFLFCIFMCHKPENPDKVLSQAIHASSPREEEVLGSSLSCRSRAMIFGAPISLLELSAVYARSLLDCLSTLFSSSRRSSAFSSFFAYQPGTKILKQISARNTPAAPKFISQWAASASIYHFSSRYRVFQGLSILFYPKRLPYTVTKK